MTGIIAGLTPPLTARDDETAEELVAQLRRLDYPLEKERDYLPFDYIRLFSAACGKGDARTLPLLVDIFEGASKNPRVRTLDLERLFPPLASLWLKVWVERHGAEIVAGPKPPVAARPGNGAALPDELQAAWRDFTGLWQTLPKPAAGDNGAATVSYFQDSRPFWRLTVSVLRGADGEWSRAAECQRYGFWCGTGAGGYYVCQSYLTLMAWLAEEKYGLALAAIFQVEDSKSFNPARDGAAVSAAWLAAQLGYDWRELALGCLLAKDQGNYDGPDDQALRMLTQSGGDWAARKILQVAQHAPPERWPRYIEALAVFVKKASRVTVHYGYMGGRAQFHPVAGRHPADDDSQREILAWFAALADDKLSASAGRQLTQVLDELQPPATAVILRKLLRQPSDTVAQSAAKALRALGEQVDAAAVTQPLRFKLLADGQPVARQRVAWALVDQWGNLRHGSGGTTDEHGVLSVSRDGLAESRSATKFVLRNDGVTDWQNVWFHIAMPPPSADETAMLPVEFATRPLTLNIKLPRPAAAWAGRPACMWVDLAGKSRMPHHSPGSDALTVNAAVRLVFPRVAAGEYSLMLTLPGAVDWLGDVMGDTAEVDLRFGCDVRYKLRSPYADRLYYRVKLEPNAGRMSAYHTQASPYFHGVPPGDYTLVVPSSAALCQERAGLLPAGVEFAETRIPFSVTEDSPVEIDLGTIEIK
ncbi:MAG: hypothetical protein LBK71_06400 [Verrucomicrobiales bacterium]|nr:hypothetical protein [Verrucomicrobiales bacterium]